MKRDIFSFLLAAIIIVVSVIHPTSTKNDSKTVADVSWPNCNVTPPTDSTWGIVGVTGGLDFHINPCLQQESSWFTHLSLYVNTGYPGGTYGDRFKTYPKKCEVNDNYCLAYNYGYNATLYAINYANKEEVHSTLWWLDVESDNSWSTSVIVNRASLQGAVDALKQHIFLPIIGFYSYPGQWNSITGNWHNSLPSWVATGSTSSLLAATACSGQSFTGGPIWLGQYTQGLDKNYACNPSFMQGLYKL